MCIEFRLLHNESVCVHEFIVIAVISVFLYHKKSGQNFDFFFFPAKKLSIHVVILLASACLVTRE